MTSWKEVRAWRETGYPGTALVTRRLLEWWFERDEERKSIGKRFECVGRCGSANYL